MNQNSNDKTDAQNRSKANCMGLSASEQSRRDFMKTSAIAGGVALGGLGGFYFGYDMSHGDPVRVGVIGTGDEGNVLIGAINPEYVEVKSIADIRPFGIHRAFHGDVSSPAALAARKGLMNVYGWKTENEARKHVKVYGPWQDLIRNAKADGIEAIILALPLHLHAPVAIVAMRHGLHVLTEKLMGHSVGNCKEMARVAAIEGKHLATGHQRHYNILYHEAVDAIRRGRLGDLHYIRAQWHRGNRPGSDSWQQPLPPGIKRDEPDKLQNEARALIQALKSATGRDIELTQMKLAQKMKQIEDIVLTETDPETGKPIVESLGYQSANINGYDRPAIEELIRWRLWQRTGGGLMAELGSHQLDAASIFIAAMHGGEKQMPLSVSASASRSIFDNDREANDHVMCTVEFATPEYDPKDPVGSRKKVTVQYSSINGNGFGGYGEIVYGTRGTLIIEREQKKTLLEEEKKTRVSANKSAALDTQASGPAQKAAAAGGPDPVVSRGYQEEIEHWAWCIRKNPNNTPGSPIHPRCYPKVALGDAVIALTANIAARKGERIEFKPEWFDIDKDETPEGVAPNLDREEYKL